LEGERTALITIAGCAIGWYIRRLMKKRKGGKALGHWREYFGYRNFVWRWKDIRERVSTLEKQVRELRDEVSTLEKNSA